ncbi:hypothetical protein C0989_001137 [Termitomyces sp. Mn162]|nr:hypothetical protein C0989_001137 [Termitomyces sp. Mn162]
MDSMLTLSDAFANPESTIKRLLTLVSGLESRLAALESGCMPMPVATVASAQTASQPTHPTSNAPLAIPFAQDLPPMDGCTPHFKCMLELPDSLVAYVVGHQGQGLKQAFDISSTHLAAFMISLAGRDHQFVSIQGSDQQIGEALAVIGK